MSVLTVTEITRMIKEKLEGSFATVTVSGEISNFRPASSGHWYFDVKDRDAVLHCAMFRGNRRGAEIMPSDGDEVEIDGSIDVYPPRGTYQLIARRLRPIGRGTILAVLEARKRALAAEGLFERSRRLPAVPGTIAVVTSPTGAAIRDVLNVLARRRREIAVRIVPVPVQGDAAGPRIAAAIRYADRHRIGETIIVTRGGGSLEDLLPFSDEAVVRAIASSDTPVISAVGHEIDWALSDFAADYRAPTPSAAAEIVSASTDEVWNTITTLRSTVETAFRDHVGEYRRRVERIGTEELVYRFRNFVQPWYQRLDEARTAATDGMRDRTRTLRHRIEILSERIAAASPFAPLQRGYAIVTAEKTGATVTSVDQTTIGDRLHLRLADGTIRTERIENEHV